MSINWKKSILVALDVVLAAYLVLAVTSFTKADNSAQPCEKISISITDDEDFGFLSAEDIKKMLVAKNIHPESKMLSDVDPRAIEDALKSNSLIQQAECYKTINGTVNIKVTQRMPYLRVMADNGSDYYIDEYGNMMQGAGYTSDLIIATGNISKWYAQNYLTPVIRHINDDDFWRNQIEQINILPDGNMEIIPRVGNHAVLLGQLPQYSDKERREREINRFLSNKLSRLEKFYLHGLNQVGWNKYEYIDIEFDNQIICKKNSKEETKKVLNDEKAEKEQTESMKQKEGKKDVKTDVKKDVPKDVKKDAPKDAKKDAPKDVKKDAPKDVKKDAPKKK